MPFPVKEQYIQKTEQELNVTFPVVFKNKMMNENGGEVDTEKFYFQLYPFFDTSDRKRISRTCNHIILETKSSQEWRGFPDNAIAIGADGSGDKIVLIHNGDGVLEEAIYLWHHETTKIERIADNINDLLV